MTNSWNKQTVINPVQEHQLLQQYIQHKHSIKQIKLSFKATVNNSQPFIFDKSTASEHRPIKELQKVRSQENQVMISKMLHIRQINSPYSLETYEESRDGQYKPSNIGQKILDMKQLIENNEGIEKRIKDAHPVIDFCKIKTEYKQNKKYLKNLSSNSRRIYNCFLGKPQNASQKELMKLPNIDMNNSPKEETYLDLVKPKKFKKGKKKLLKLKKLQVVQQINFPQIELNSIQKKEETFIREQETPPEIIMPHPMQIVISAATPSETKIESSVELINHVEIPKEEVGTLNGSKEELGAEPEEMNEEKLEEKPEEKSEENTEEKPEEKTEEKPEQKPDDKQEISNVDDAIINNTQSDK